MTVFLCRWPLGDFSIVDAPDRNEAIIQLDETGNAEGCTVVPIKGCLINFKLTDEGRFELEDFGELTDEQVWRYYSSLERAFEESEGSSIAERQEILRLAVQKERTRVKNRKTAKPRTLVGERMKAAVDKPTIEIDRIVEDLARKSLKGFKGKGKAS
jgi:hypothetical protein